MMVNVFDSQKKESLNGLDHSKKGTFDAPIHELIVYINSLNDLFTTSSCSGRIIVFVEGDVKKKGCKWLITSHEPIQPKQVIESIETVNDVTNPVIFKSESFILHVQCRTQEIAQEMLKVALECGYRNSGLVIGKKKKIMLAVRSTHGMEVPLMFNKQIKVSNEYMEELVNLANLKLEENFTRINKFFDKVKSSFKNDIECNKGTPIKDIKIPSTAPKELLLDKHSSYIKAYEEKKSGYEYIMSEYLRMSGIYWCLTSMSLLKKLHIMNREEVLQFIDTCWHSCGGYSASVDHDPHLLYTLSAIQILVLFDELDKVDRHQVAQYISSLQQDDGSFMGDKWGEIDSRFSFCAIASLVLIGKLDAINVDKAIEYVVSCMNFDGGFGCTPGSESHAGQIYCCVGVLSMTHSLHHIDPDQLGWWLCERQLPSGGLNGRPEKLPDVCYSWWVLASLKAIGKIKWIDKDKLCEFILASQDEELGGISDRPGDMVDPFHTLFGIAGLSLLQFDEESIESINPIFCLPQSVVERMGVTTQLL